MTFVGKVLVVVQVFLSLCFMAFAGAVFTVQQDWKEAYEKKVTELDSKNQELNQRDQQISLLSSDLAASQAIEEDIQNYLQQFDQFLGTQTENDQIKTSMRMLAQRAQRAEQQVDMLEGQVATLEAQLMETKQSYENLKIVHENVTTEAKERAQEVAILRKNYNDVNNQLAQATDRNSNLIDQLFNLENSAKDAAEKQKSLLMTVAHLKSAIRVNGIDVEQALTKDEPPPQVSGRVLNTKAADRNGPELIEISLGSDDGLDEGHRLEVYSLNGRGKYLGQIEVVYLEGDRAVGKVILKSKNGVIERGDNVTTKLF